MYAVSVVIPVFNGSAFVSDALRSVLGQSRVADEIVVVDDGSTDRSATIVAEFAPSVRLIKQPHRGCAAAINTGIAQTDRGLVAFLDADDLWAPDKLAQQIAVLAGDPHLEAVFGNLEEFSDPTCTVRSPQEIGSLIRRVAGISKSTILIRRASLERVGMFDCSVAVADFLDWYSRAQKAGLRTQLIDEVVAYRRVHNSNTSRMQKKALHRDYLRIARAAVHRREGR